MPHDPLDLVKIRAPFPYEGHRSPADKILLQVSKAISFDSEGNIRQALIDLGWTPPDESDEPDQSLQMACEGLDEPGELNLIRSWLDLAALVIVVFCVVIVVKLVLLVCVGVPV